MSKHTIKKKVTVQVYTCDTCQGVVEGTFPQGWTRYIGDEKHRCRTCNEKRQAEQPYYQAAKEFAKLTGGAFVCVGSASPEVWLRRWAFYFSFPGCVTAERLSNPAAVGGDGRFFDSCDMAESAELFSQAANVLAKYCPQEESDD